MTRPASPAKRKPVVRCVKCGGRKIRTFYCNDGDDFGHRYNGRGHAHERLHKVCENCKYEWTIPCLPSPRRARRAR